MDNDPPKQRRRSIRLREYDYSLPGAYFLTICAHNRRSLFGSITDGQMALNDAGRTIEEWWQKLPMKYPNVEIDESVVMPNHFHGLLCIHDVGAAPRGRPLQTSSGRPHGGAPTLGSIVAWFKTMTTNAYIRGVKQRGWPAFDKSLWQRNYYEHIVRNERELEKIREYIALNPANWASDRENPAAMRPSDPKQVWQV